MSPLLLRLESQPGVLERDEVLICRVDICGFEPEQLCIELGEQELVVRAERCLKSGRGQEIRNLVQRIQFPRSVRRETLRCHLREQAGGGGPPQLCVTARRGQSPPANGATPVPVQVQHNGQ